MSDISFDKDFFSKLVTDNIDGLVIFIEQLLAFDGKINFQYLYKVVESEKNIEVVKCSEGEKINDYAVVIGGEVSNSFCPLYEVAYFFQALFLSTVGTAFLNKYKLQNKIEYDNKSLRKRIRQYLLELTDKEIRSALLKPSINIICSFDTDIEPYRYVKHQLWRLEEKALKKRCYQITKEDFGKEVLDESLKDIYWVEKDNEIAEKAMLAANLLSHAKTVQYYLTIKEILIRLNIDISRLPWYFNFVPKEEILLLGPDNEFLEVIIALHEKRVLRILSELTKSSTPWIVSFSCPQCAESSKKIINAKLKADCKTVHLVCSHSPHEFRDEMGNKIIRKGCDYTWDVKIPDNPRQLYALLKEKSFTIHGAIKYLLRIIKTTTCCPLSLPVTEVGIRKREEKLGVVSNLPKGYGDHRNLLTSILALQHLFIKGAIASKLSHKLKEKDILTLKPMQLLSWTSENKLYDKDVFCIDKKELQVMDTSALKALEKGLPAEDLFKNSIDLNELQLEQLLKLQGKSLEEVHEITQK